MRLSAERKFVSMTTCVLASMQMSFIGVVLLLHLDAGLLHEVTPLLQFGGHQGAKLFWGIANRRGADVLHAFAKRRIAEALLYRARNAVDDFGRRSGRGEQAVPRIDRVA